MKIACEPLQLTAHNLTFSADRYPAKGKKRGTALCLHGFPDSKHSYSEIGPRLAAEGYDVIAPALRGYESQNVVSAKQYYLSDMASDVLEWLPQLGSDPLHLIGHDWGGAIGGLVASQTTLSSYTCLAIPPTKGFLPALTRYPSQVRHSWYMLFFQLRGFADKRFAANHYAFVERLWRDWSPDWQYSADDLNIAKETFQQPGVAKAALNYYRCQLNFASQQWRRTNKATSQPILAPSLYLAGKNDGCMHSTFYRHAMDESQFPHGVSLEILPNCGHFLHREKPEAIARRILAHMNSNG